MRIDQLSPGARSHVESLFGKPLQDRPERVKTPVIASDVGTRLHDLFTEEFGEVPQCGGCAAAILRLNHLTTAEIRDRREREIDDIYSRRYKAQAYWQKVAILLDDVLDTGIVRHKIGELLDRACDESETKHVHAN